MSERNSTTGLKLDGAPLDKGRLEKAEDSPGFGTSILALAVIVVIALTIRKRK